MTDTINPPHYTDGWSNGAEVIDITENLNYNRGNAVKYIARAGVKSSDTEVEDLRKALWYLTREIYRLEASGLDPILDKKMQQEEQASHYAADTAVPPVVSGDQYELMKKMTAWPNPLLPRVWYSIKEVPEGVRVVDRTGAFWWGAEWRSLEFAVGHVLRTNQEFGPFTEAPLPEKQEKE